MCVCVCAQGRGNAQVCKPMKTMMNALKHVQNAIEPVNFCLIINYSLYYTQSLVYNEQMN